MIMTDHAKTRSKQRGFSKHVIDTIVTNGKQQPTSGGAMKIFIGKKEHQAIVTELKRAIHVIDKARNSTLIINGDNIITAYKRK